MRPPCAPPGQPPTRRDRRRRPRSFPHAETIGSPHKRRNKWTLRCFSRSIVSGSRRGSPRECSQILPQSLARTGHAAARFPPNLDYGRMRPQSHRGAKRGANGYCDDVRRSSWPGGFPGIIQNSQEFQQKGEGQEKKFADRTSSGAKSPAKRRFLGVNTGPECTECGSKAATMGAELACRGCGPGARRMGFRGVVRDWSK